MAASAELGPQALDEIVRTAEAAAREAGALLLEHLGHLDPGKIRSKSAARDLVTAADVESERLLVARLRRAFPGHAIEAEEEVRDARDDRPRWYLDPLDGTINFVQELPAFSVSMGLYLGREPLAGVVHLPKLAETFTARRGGGAWLDGRAIHVSETATLAEAVLATGFPYRRNELPNNNVDNFNRFILDCKTLGG